MAEVVSATERCCPVDLHLGDDRTGGADVDRLLRLERFQPLEAAHGRAGVELDRRERPDVILCDVMVPETDGHEVLAALRQDPNLKATPFIFLTARGEKPDVRAGMNRVVAEGTRR